MTIFATIGDFLLVMYALSLLFAQLFPKTADQLVRNIRATGSATPRPSRAASHDGTEREPSG